MIRSERGPEQQPARPSRRGVLRILAAGAALPLGALGVARLSGTLRDLPMPQVWQGEALGALAQVTIWDGDATRARAILMRVRAELARLQAVFDLHDPQAELARLNAQGRLTTPSRDLRKVLEAALRMAEASGGAFDPTVQPLWRARFQGATAADVADARALVGWRGVGLDRRGIRLAQSGMALTLNGIAQGYAADRVAALLAEAGLHEALIDAGEIRALGHGPAGQGHEVALIDPLDPRSIAPGPGLRLAETALAVSGGYGMRLADGGHHILDPHSGRSPVDVTEAVVAHPSAMLADGLSTALYVAGPAQAAALMAAHPAARARLRLADGTVLRLGTGSVAL